MDKYPISVQEQVAHGAGGADHFSAPGLVTFPPAKDIVHVPNRLTTFHELYNRYASEVYRFAHWLTGNPDDARDITSETFIRVWTAAEETRLESVKAYLFTIARNLHRKQWRRQSRLVPLDDTMADLPGLATAPDQAAVGQEDFQRTMAALQTLPELDRTVILLRAEEDLSYADIAAATGLSVVAAKVRVFRARAKLAALLHTNPETKP